MEKEILRTELKLFCENLLQGYVAESTILELLGTDDTINDYIDNQLKERWQKLPNENSNCNKPFVIKNEVANCGQPKLTYCPFFSQENKCRFYGKCL